MTTRLLYVDDSGADASRWAVYGWVEMNIADWRPALRAWLDWRQHLYETIGLPASYELHATKFVNGRGRPTNTDWDLRKANRSAVMVETLTTLAALPGVRVGAVCRRSGHHTHAADKAALYADLVTALDRRLTENDEYGLITMDGDGTDPSYRSAHRNLKLATRRIVEDPAFQGSHISQLMQIADLVAYSAYMQVLRHPAKQLMWGWYPDLLGGVCMVGGQPLLLEP
ncbi:DUF3800 domain-containing protein [Crossiella cryophila]|uniref:DUF3800 domain-containing protein n=1 Tax=Crossiella cryophila TaxID=43355 RepID=A0A7W7CAD1_9PSEU|nr:DUF3800 domain-containing protein [Crossiella cryophila]MBB4676218.1 hypothetical protein [Crossiella cryophila]